MSVADIFKREILEILEETFEQVRGIYLDRNTSLLETLATISADEASIPVGGRCATLAAQVEHVRFYIDLLTEVMEGKQVGKVDWGEIWRTVSSVTPNAWEISKTRLRESYDHVRTAIANFTTCEGEDEIAGALAILTHTAYHLGEIRQALCSLKP